MAAQGVHKLEIEEEEEDDHPRQQQQQQLSLSDSIDLDADDVNNSVNKAPRLPRWTRQEILVLIQGKKVAENRVRRGRTAAMTTSCVEPKWATVSSYCKRHGVNRGSVQCRKRWSNLAGDFKKIKEWESLHVSDDADSFWLMRNDLRRERKLPGFFDREVFDILDDKKELVPPDSPPPTPTPLLLFDSGRPAPPDDALFSDFNKQAIPLSIPTPTPTPIPAPTPISISAKQYEAFTPAPQIPGVVDEKQAGPDPEIGSTSQGERKRKRLVVEEETETETEIEGASASLLQVMEKNGRMLSAQLEAHNMNLKLDREDRKDHASSLVAVLNKLADALARIADKL